MLLRPPSSNLSTERVKLVVAYDGTDFRGWAAQTGHRTVQSTLTEAVRRTTGEDLELAAASRTDSGAHAIGQVVHFDTCSKVPVDRLARVLNTRLPLDCRVQSSEAMPDDFHCRFSAYSRYYRYTIKSTNLDPFSNRKNYYFYGGLDLDSMREAAAQLVGIHDFIAFTEELEPHVKNTIRELFSIEILSNDDEIYIDIVGTAFLRGMMRRISGFLLEVGRHHRPVTDTSKLLDHRRDHLEWSVVLPARGLCLMNVEYRFPYPDYRK